MTIIAFKRPDIINNLTSSLPPDVDVVTLVTHAAAIAASRWSPIPTLEEYRDKSYLNKVELFITDVITRVNEVFVIDVDQAQDIANAYYLTRLSALFPSMSIFASADDCITCDVLGVSKFFRKIDTSLVNQYKAEVFKIYDEIVKYLKICTVQVSSR